MLVDTSCFQRGGRVCLAYCSIPKRFYNLRPALFINTRYIIRNTVPLTQGLIFFYRTEDGSRQVDDHLVMYNNPLFGTREKVKRGAGKKQLTLDSDWNVVFDL